MLPFSRLSLVVSLFALIVGTYSPVFASQWATTVQDSASSKGVPVMLIIDGSGSMWGRLEGKAKISIVRDRLPNVLKRLQKSTRLGIMAYGHRRKRSCSDIQLLAPVLAVGPKHYKSIAKVSPRGKTPITGAIEAAARAVNAKKEAAHIVLLSDGAENCRRDPCAMAAQLKKTSKALKIHVVSFGLSPDKARALQCLARNTGGEFEIANSGKALEAALGAVFASFEHRPEKKSLPAPKPQLAPVLKVKPKPVLLPPALHLSAVLKKDGPALSRDVVWFVSKLNAKAGELEKYTSPQPKLDIAPGAYYVEANFGPVRVVREVLVKKNGPTKIELVLNASTLRIKTNEDGVAGPVRQVLTVSRLPDGAAPRELVRQTDNVGAYKLQAGTYEVRLASGRAVLKRTVSLKAGDRQILTLNPKIAILKLGTIAALGGRQVEDVAYEVFPIEPQNTEAEKSALPARSSVSGPQPIARTLAQAPIFHLAPGGYRVRVISGHAVAEKTVTLLAGSHKSLNVVLPSGVLHLKSKLAVTAPGATAVHSYKIFALGDEFQSDAGKKSVQVRHMAPKIRLPAGRYRVEARAGFVNVAKVQTVTLGPGDDLDVDFRLDAGLLQPVMRGKKGGLPLRHVFWRIRGTKGRVLHFTREPIPKILLAPGLYRVDAVFRGRTITQNVKVTAGEQKRLDIIRPNRG